MPISQTTSTPNGRRGPLLPTAAMLSGGPKARNGDPRPRSAQPAARRRLVRLDPRARQGATAQSFADYVLKGAHPCVMARSVVNKELVFVAEYGELGAPANSGPICHDLYEVLATSEAEGSMASLVAVFPARRFDSEPAFEAALWAQLNALHLHDRKRFAWDPTVSADVNDPNFSFSVGGAAWYVVGLHPGASRMSRRFQLPALVFNRHAQFEAMREAGRYNAMRDHIRERDVALQGSVNPMLKNHGEASEAMQYAGREVGAAWRCPFAPASSAPKTD